MSSPKTFFLIGFFCLLVGKISLSAQNAPTIGTEVDFQVKFGEEIRQKRGVELKIAGYDQDAIYILKYTYGGFTSSEVVLEKLDKNYNIVKSVEYPMEVNRRRRVEFIVHINHRLYLFTSFTDTESHQNTLYVEEIDKESLTSKGDKRIVSMIGFEKKSLDGYYDYEIARDKSHILIFAKTEARKKDPEMYHFHVFNRDMQEVWNRKVVLNDTEDRLFVVKDIEVGNDGKVYLMAKEFKEKPKEKRKGNVNFHYTVLAYHDEETPVLEYPVMLEDKFLTDMNIEITREGDIICAGFFSNKGTYSIRGTYYLTVDAQTKGVRSQSFMDFDVDFLTQFMRRGQEKRVRRKEAKGKEPEMYEFDMRDLLIREDGSASLIAEQYYVVVITYTDPKTGFTRTTYYYYYNNIIVVDIDKTGKINWARQIPKLQVSVNDGGFYSSFAHAAVDSDIYFVYNDSKKNYTGKYPKKLANYRVSEKKGMTTIMKIDAEGNLSRRPMSGNDEIATIIRPKLSEQISPRELLLFGIRKRKNQFGAVTF
ncbi:MAG: hypothetical protein H6581_01390 [Bacteroidia bacterium]|nr:hypothetical protein [Bacteroidia bacterium]